ncbi:MAG: hypothetical protein DRI88_01870 [Bacteroidetes bacterium]|nr:MAG: hypothetical protein DRI72_01555 [Bacteroidota bacterium]RLD48930.1 MAG: hypothetical protein DRI88_01870 [Bacteroidota bacterium]
MMDVKIVAYKKGDYKILVDLWERSGLPYKPLGRDKEETIEKELKRGVGKFLFAMLDGKYIGTVLVTHDGRKGWINRVAVVPEYRHKGIARILVEAAEKWLNGQGIEIYACQIEDYNKESLEVFKKLGYIPFEGIHYLTKRKYPEV